jgi:hypothetical protein
MPTLILQGKEYQVSIEEVYQGVTSLVKGYAVLAQMYSNFHISGFSDWNHNFQHKEKGQTEFSNELIRNIDDPEILAGLTEIKEDVNQLVQQDDKITAWLAKLVNVEPANRRRLRSKLDKIIREGELGGPSWALEDGFQSLASESNVITARIINSTANLHGLIEARLQQDK